MLKPRIIIVSHNPISSLCSSMQCDSSRISVLSLLQYKSSRETKSTIAACGPVSWSFVVPIDFYKWLVNLLLMADSIATKRK